MKPPRPNFAAKRGGMSTDDALYGATPVPQAQRTAPEQRHAGTPELELAEGAKVALSTQLSVEAMIALMQMKASGSTIADIVTDAILALAKHWPDPLTPLPPRVLRKIYDKAK